MPIDVTPIKTFIEGEMVDTVEIYRGNPEDAFDPWTGQITPGTNTQLYDGPGLVLSINAYPNQVPEGEATASYIRYDLYVPLTCPPLLSNDLVVLVNSVRDPQINGTTYIIESSDHSSVLVARKAQITYREVAGQISP